MDPSLFVKQHHEILAVVEDIQIQLRQPSMTPEDGNHLRSSLVSLSGKVITHLAAEDNALYPRLLASQNADVSRTAKRFAHEMGSIAERFESYIGKWFSGRVISSKLDEFRAESGEIFGALGERIKREESELYPLARND